MTTQKISFDDRGMEGWIAGSEREAYQPAAALAEEMLQKGTGPGSAFLGWLRLPEKISGKEIEAIRRLADDIRSKADMLICIGIGGSYLGAKAAIEFCTPSFEDLRIPRVVFAGHQVNSDYLTDLLRLIDDKKVCVNVISKSGTTTEPGITFRVLRAWMEKRYGKKEAAARTFATTDPSKGALRKLATDEGYATLSIPSDVGGRYSVLTPVGLLPIAVAGIDIQQLVDGSREAAGFCSAMTLEKNQAARYAVVRNILMRKGMTLEVLAGFQPQLHYVCDWWKQLAGESEGKDRTGIFPAAVDYTTDLHSLGQWMQEGLRNVFETFMILKRANAAMTVPAFEDDLDGLNFVAGKSFEEINLCAFQGTVLAHRAGGVPTSIITLEDRSAQTLGQLLYFFEKAIALSGYILRVNPFDQPGVEAYKNNMFALLQKPGYEEKGRQLLREIQDLGL
jgi:glucose-6-phosphate isomerase